MKYLVLTSLALLTFAAQAKNVKLSELKTRNYFCAISTSTDSISVDVRATSTESVVEILTILADTGALPNVKEKATDIECSSTFPPNM